MGIVNDIIESFYSSTFYANVGQVRRGIGMKFIFALTLITTLLFTGYVIFYSHTLSKLTEQLPALANELPAFTIKDGKFSMDKPSPYNLPIGEEGNKLNLSINTSYKVGDLKTLKDNLALKNYMEANKINILITEYEYVVKADSGALDAHKFSEIRKDASVTHAEWVSSASFIATNGVRLLIIIVFIVCLVGSFISNMVATFIGALVMYVISLIIRANIEFGAAMRLTAAARMAFSAIIAAPLMIGGGYIIGGVSWLIWLGYLVFAVLANKPKGAV